MASSNDPGPRLDDVNQLTEAYQEARTDLSETMRSMDERRSLLARANSISDQIDVTRSESVSESVRDALDRAEKAAQSLRSAASRIWANPEKAVARIEAMHYRRGARETLQQIATQPRQLGTLKNRQALAWAKAAKQASSPDEAFQAARGTGGRTFEQLLDRTATHLGHKEVAEGLNAEGANEALRAETQQRMKALVNGIVESTKVVYDNPGEAYARMKAVSEQFQVSTVAKQLLNGPEQFGDLKGEQREAEGEGADAIDHHKSSDRVQAERETKILAGLVSQMGQVRRLQSQQEQALLRGREAKGHIATVYEALTGRSISQAEKRALGSAPQTAPRGALAGRRTDGNRLQEGHSTSRSEVLAMAKRGLDEKIEKTEPMEVLVAKYDEQVSKVESAGKQLRAAREQQASRSESPSESQEAVESEEVTRESAPSESASKGEKDAQRSSGSGLGSSNDEGRDVGPGL